VSSLSTAHRISQGLTSLPTPISPKPVSKTAPMDSEHHSVNDFSDKSYFGNLYYFNSMKQAQSLVKLYELSECRPVFILQSTIQPGLAVCALHLAV